VGYRSHALDSSSAPPSRPLTYAGIFLVALATLMLEVLLTRVTSVIAWYHLAFFVISLAMLGMTAGAVMVFLLPRAFADEHVPKRMTQTTLAFAATTPIAAGMAMSMPLMPITGLMDFFSLLAYGGILAIPFGLGGIALTLALTRAKLPASIAYGVDLVGAAMGCALVIPLLDRVDAPSAAVMTSAIAALAGACFSLAHADGRKPWRRMIGPVLLAVALIWLGSENRMSWDHVRNHKQSKDEASPLRPAWVKGGREKPGSFCFIGWNTYSRITVEHTSKLPPFLWASSREMPEHVRAPIPQRTIRIDGAAATMMFRHGDELSAHQHIDWDITSFAHELRKTGPAAVIGVGGGRDVIVAARHGHETVVGIELNDLIVTLHTKIMEDFSRITRIPGVELIAAEARSHMAQETRRFSVITMSLIDTWATTGAGSYSLSENGLYTAEAWQIFMDRLEPTGIYTVSRWYHPKSPGETTRMLALAMEVLWRMGVERPQDHIILLQNKEVATILLTPTPFSKADLDLMQKRAGAFGYSMIATPRRGPLHEGPLQQLWAIESQDALWQWTSSQDLDYTPPTDDRPFFFNMLKPQTWLQDPDMVDKLDVSFLGNLQATQTLVHATLVSVLLTLMTVIGPMLIRRRELVSADKLDLAASAGYFALIGLGFMFVEIGLLSRLNVFIGHPTVALAVLLGGIIFFTGIGSLLSGRVEVEQRPKLARFYPLIPFSLVVLAVLASGPLTHAFQASGMSTRVMVGLLVVAVPALGMGLGFPVGLRLVQARHRITGGPELGPWLWGINGACGVCASGLALGCSMVWGVPTTLAVGAGCYLLLLACTQRLARSTSTRPV
jgi:MFS family permease